MLGEKNEVISAAAVLPYPLGGWLPAKQAEPSSPSAALPVPWKGNSPLIAHDLLFAEQIINSGETRRPETQLQTTLKLQGWLCSTTGGFG